MFFTNHFNPYSTESCSHSISDAYLKEQLRQTKCLGGKKHKTLRRRWWMRPTDGVEISKVNQHDQLGR